MKNVSKANYKRSTERYLCFLCQNSDLVYSDVAYENIFRDLKASKRLKNFARRICKKYVFPCEF
jgi:hypothetical protein